MATLYSGSLVVEASSMWGQHWQGQLYQLWQRRELCDTYILPKEAGHGVLVHSTVLAAASSVCQPLMRDRCNLRLDNISRHIVDLFVTFIYTGKIMAPPAELRSLLAVAVYLQVEPLAQAVTDALKESGLACQAPPTLPLTTDQHLQSIVDAQSENAAKFRRFLSTRPQSALDQTIPVINLPPPLSTPAIQPPIPLPAKPEAKPKPKRKYNRRKPKLTAPTEMPPVMLNSAGAWPANALPGTMCPSSTAAPLQTNTVPKAPISASGTPVSLSLNTAQSMYVQSSASGMTSSVFNNVNAPNTVLPASNNSTAVPNEKLSNRLMDSSSICDMQNAASAISSTELDSTDAISDSTLMSLLSQPVQEAALREVAKQMENSRLYDGKTRFDSRQETKTHVQAGHKETMPAQVGNKPKVNQNDTRPHVREVEYKMQQGKEQHQGENLSSILRSNVSQASHHNLARTEHYNAARSAPPNANYAIANDQDIAISITHINRSSSGHDGPTAVVNLHQAPSARPTNNTLEGLARNSGAVHQHQSNKQPNPNSMSAAQNLSYNQTNFQQSGQMPLHQIQASSSAHSSQAARTNSVSQAPITSQMQNSGQNLHQIHNVSNLQQTYRQAQISRQVQNDNSQASNASTSNLNQFPNVTNVRDTKKYQPTSSHSSVSMQYPVPHSPQVSNTSQIQNTSQVSNQVQRATLVPASNQLQQPGQEHAGVYVHNNQAQPGRQGQYSNQVKDTSKVTNPSQLSFAQGHHASTGHTSTSVPNSSQASHHKRVDIHPTSISYMSHSAEEMKMAQGLKAGAAIENRNVNINPTHRGRPASGTNANTFSDKRNQVIFDAASMSSENPNLQLPQSSSHTSASSSATLAITSSIMTQSCNAPNSSTEKHHAVKHPLGIATSYSNVSSHGYQPFPHSNANQVIRSTSALSTTVNPSLQHEKQTVPFSQETSQQVTSKLTTLFPKDIDGQHTAQVSNSAPAIQHMKPVTSSEFSSKQTMLFSNSEANPQPSQTLNITHKSGGSNNTGSKQFLDKFEMALKDGKDGDSLDAESLVARLRSDVDELTEMNMAKSDALGNFSFTNPSSKLPSKCQSIKSDVRTSSFQETNLQTKVLKDGQAMVITNELNGKSKKGRKRPKAKTLNQEDIAGIAGATNKRENTETCSLNKNHVQEQKETTHEINSLTDGANKPSVSSSNLRNQNVTLSMTKDMASDLHDIDKIRHVLEMHEVREDIDKLKRVLSEADSGDEYTRDKLEGPLFTDSKESMAITSNRYAPLSGQGNEEVETTEQSLCKPATVEQKTSLASLLQQTPTKRKPKGRSQKRGKKGKAAKATTSASECTKKSTSVLNVNVQHGVQENTIASSNVQNAKKEETSSAQNILDAPKIPPEWNIPAEVAPARRRVTRQQTGNLPPITIQPGILYTDKGILLMEDYAEKNTKKAPSRVSRKVSPAAASRVSPKIKAKKSPIKEAEPTRVSPRKTSPRNISAKKDSLSPLAVRENKSPKNRSKTSPQKKKFVEHAQECDEVVDDSGIATKKKRSCLATARQKKNYNMRSSTQRVVRGTYEDMFEDISDPLDSENLNESTTSAEGLNESSSILNVSGDSEVADEPLLEQEAKLTKMKVKKDGDSWKVADHGKAIEIADDGATSADTVGYSSG